MKSSPATASLETALQAYVDRGDLAGVVTVAWRRGAPVHTVAIGRRDAARDLPVARDTIFMIASLTKPVTAVAALSMLDEGRFALDEPVTRVAPELTNLRVLQGSEGPIDHSLAATRAITFEDLLTHRSGLTYGEFHHGPIRAAYATALGPTIDNPLTPDEWIARLATLPLVDQPGAAFHYGVSSDLLGFLLARMEGTTVGDVLRKRVFEPLGMQDTGFVVSPDKRHRRAALTGFDEAGHLISLHQTPGGHALAERPDAMTFESGGQGLWSTAADYLTFARLFVGDGAVDGVRILKPETCRLMASNRLTAAQRASARMFGQPLFDKGHGYGMGVAVVMEPDHADVYRCRGGVGTVGWPGAFGSWWQADPTDGSVLVFLSHNMPELSQLAQGVGLGAWSAIAEFHALA